MNDLTNSLTNEQEIYTTSIIKDEIQFNDFSLMDFCKNWVWISVINPDFLSENNIKLKIYESEDSNWWKIINKTNWIKTSNMEIFIQWASYYDLMNRIDDLKKNLDWINWKLYILVNWEHRVYEATCNNIIIPRITKLDDFVSWIIIDWKISSPFWFSENPSIIYALWKTANFQESVNNIWNWKAYPRFIISWKSWCNITSLNIEILKYWETSWYNLTINENIINNSVLNIDYLLKTAKLNSVEKRFYWFMTPLDLGTNIIKFTFTWTVNIDCSILYNKVWK